MDYSKKGTRGDRDERGPSAGKIFVGGLSWETTTEKLTRHFQKFGEIVDSVVMKNRSTRQPRGFGFVTYADPSVIDKVIKETHLIDGRTVEIKRSVPRDSMVKGPRTKKIFVGGLLPSVTEGEFKRYFSQFGTVIEAQIMLEHGTGRPRGFGFITFDSEQQVDDLLSQEKTFELGGKQVEIKKAEPKKASDEPVRGYGSPPGRGGYGYKVGGYDSYDDMHDSRLGYGGKDYGMRSRGYGDGPGAYSAGVTGFGDGPGAYSDRGYGVGAYGSSSFGGYGSSGGGYGGYGGSMLGQLDGDSYAGMGYSSYGSGYGGGSFGGGGYGSPGAYRGGYGPSSSYGSDYGYGRSSGRFHPYGRN